MYASERNYDKGQDAHDSVSCLSPWVRVRALTEESIAKRVLETHTLPEAEKFIQEICWRTYWKGWLAQRPSVWSEYEQDLAESREHMRRNIGYARAISGETEFESFNTWVGELQSTGYLHNHARMWFASIWIHTLKLPWQLGAAFFLEHLLDGDCASNTLSWRWVAGRQTLGKAYSASAQNIRRYTQGRLGAGEFFSEANVAPEDLPSHPKPIELSPSPVPEIFKNTGLLITEDDVRSWECFEMPSKFKAVAAIFPSQAYEHHSISPSVVSFRKFLLAESLREVMGASGSNALFDDSDIVQSVLIWAKENRLTSMVVAEPAVGLWSKLWPQVQTALEAQGISATVFRRSWDDAFYPHAKKGFFNLKKQIPKIVASYV